MSSLRVHTAQSVLTSAALYPLMGSGVIPFGMAVIFIDLDHVVSYVRDTRCLDVRGVFPQCRLIEDNMDKYYLVWNMFHTVEFVMLVGLLGLKNPVFLYVLAGLLYHLSFDMAHLLRVRYPFCRVFSVLEYAVRIRDRKYVGTIRELMRKDGLDTSGVRDLNKWLNKWGIAYEHSDEPIHKPRSAQP